MTLVHIMDPRQNIREVTNRAKVRAYNYFPLPSLESFEFVFANGLAYVYRSKTFKFVEHGKIILL